MIPCMIFFSFFVLLTLISCSSTPMDNNDARNNKSLHSINKMKERIANETILQKKAKEKAELNELENTNNDSHVCNTSNNAECTSSIYTQYYDKQMCYYDNNVHQYVNFNRILRLEHSKCLGNLSNTLFFYISKLQKKLDCIVRNCFKALEQNACELRIVKKYEFAEYDHMLYFNIHCLNMSKKAIHFFINNNLIVLQNRITSMPIPKKIKNYLLDFLEVLKQTLQYLDYSIPSYQLQNHVNVATPHSVCDSTTLTKNLLAVCKNSYVRNILSLDFLDCGEIPIFMYDHLKISFNIFLKDLDLLIKRIEECKYIIKILDGHIMCIFYCSKQGCTTDYLLIK